jgi:ABC-type lipoprotein export system ATPase subunit
MIRNITVLGRRGMKALPDLVERVELKMGDVVSIVGPTGSGKATLINDIELFANGNTPSRRHVLFNGAPALVDGPSALVIFIRNENHTAACALAINLVEGFN